MGYPISNINRQVSNYIDFSVLPYRAYQLIYNEYYRDQNLTPPIDFSKASGNFAAPSEREKLFTLRKRAWEKTTSLLHFLGHKEENS